MSSDLDQVLEAIERGMSSANKLEDQQLDFKTEKARPKRRIKTLQRLQSASPMPLAATSSWG